MDKAGSLNRASTILAAIARGSSKGSLLTELILRTGLPRTTVVRTLDNLLELGWVVRTPQDMRFNLGLDLAGLGYSAISRNPLERIASVELTQLAESLGQMVYLAIRSNLDMVCIGRYECRSEIQIGRGGVGLRGPFGMTQSCMGMMARLPQKEVDEIVEANLPRYYRIEGFDETGFRQTIKKAQKNGYGTFDNIILDRTTSGLGVAIMDATGYPIAGIGTTYLTGWLDETGQKRCLEELQQAAANIEAKLLR
ncbi:MAG TPA: IclR family transcriptional regulator [Methylophilaceae bacterium]|nr:IclR family transcriptional regulator [Methylophilaceae bacterium]